jgi:hypothetical protein
MDLKFQYVEKSDITNTDILDSVDDDSLGIFLTNVNSADYWIEHKQFHFQVSLGLGTIVTTSFKHAQTVLEGLIISN